MADNYMLDGGNYTQEEVLAAAKNKELTIDAYINEYYPDDFKDNMQAMDSNMKTDTKVNVDDSEKANEYFDSNPQVTRPQIYSKHEGLEKMLLGLDNVTEEDYVPALNKFYQQKGVDVRFEEANPVWTSWLGGKTEWNNIEVLIGDQKEGEGYVIPMFDMSGTSTLSQISGKIRSHIDMNMDDKYSKTNNIGGNEEEVYEQLLNIWTVNDFLAEDNQENRAEFAHVGDVNTGKIEEETRVMRYADKDRLMLDIKTGGKRLTYRSGVARTLGELVTLGGFDQHIADMSGDVTLEDGTIIPYEYIFDKKEEILNYGLKKINDRLGEEKVEKFGSEEEYNNYIADNAWVYFKEDDQEYYKLKQELKNINEGKSEGDKDAVALRLEKIADKKGYKKLYDTQGNFIDIQLGEAEEGSEAETIDNNAQKLVDRHDKTVLTDLRRKSALRLENYAKIAGSPEGLDQITESVGLGSTSNLGSLIIGGVGAVFDPSEDSLHDDVSSLKQVVKSNDLFGSDKPLTNLPGGSEIALRFKDELLNFKTLSRALDLNVNIAKVKEEVWWKETVDNLSQSLVGDDIFSTTEDESRDAFEAKLEYEGYDVDKRGENQDWGWNRETYEAVSEIGTDLAPLLLELYALKKVGGTKKIDTAVKNLANMFTKGHKSKTWAKVVDKLIVPAIATPIEWSVAEISGQNLMGGSGTVNSQGDDAWKAHTINTETGETNFTMPAVMGMMGPVWKKLSGEIHSRYMKNSTIGRKILPRVTNPEGTFYNVRKGGGRMVGQGTTGSAMLMVAETAQAVIDEAIKEGDNGLVEKLKDTWTVEHFMNTAAALTILSAGKVHPSWKDAFKRDMLHLKGSTVESKNAAKALNIKENSTSDTINTAVNSKINKIKKDKNLSKEEITEKIKEVRTHGKHLNVFNTIKAEKRRYKNANKTSELLKKKWEDFENLKEDLTSKNKDFQSIADLKPWQLEDLLRRNGVELNTSTADYYMAVRDAVDYITQVSDIIGYKKSDSTRNDYIRTTLSIMRNKNRIKDIEGSIKEGKSNTELEAELKSLKETNKSLSESNDIRFNQYQKKWNSLLKAEVSATKKLAEKLGSTLKQYNLKQWAALKTKNGEKVDKDAEAAYIDGVLYLNMKVLKETKNLGAPVHELIHHVLRNTFKYEKGHKKEGKITTEGINVIKQLVNKFSLKDQAIIQKRIDDNYRYEENLDGSFKTNDKKQKIERPEEDYYEEYITSISDAIKNKEIKYDTKTMRRAGRIVFPWLKNKVGMESLYKYDLNGTRSKKAAEDLYNLLGDVSAAKTVRAETIEGLKKLVGDKPGLHPDAVTSKNTDIYQNERIFENLGITKNSTKEIIEKNRKIEDDIVKENIRDVNGNLQASTKNQQKLVENNMAASFKLALEAANKAKNITLEEGLKYDDVNEWFSDYNIKLVDLARTYRAERVFDPKTKKPISPPEKIPFGAYMGGLLPKKYSGILEAGKTKLQAKSMSDADVAKKVGKIASSSPGTFETGGRIIKIADRLGPQGKRIKEMVMKTVKLISDKPYSIKDGKRIDLTQSTFKSLKNVVLKEVQKDIFGIDPKTGNLSKTDVKNAQMVINKHAETFISMLPEHHTVKMVNIGTAKNPVYEARPDRATGVENVLLEAFYTKGIRKDNLTPWAKKKNINIKDFLEVFGVMERGVSNSYKKDSNTSARIHALVKQVERMVVNQSVRERLNEMGFAKEEWFSVVAEGRSEAMYSKNVYRNENVNESTILDFDSRKRQFHRDIALQGLSKISIRRAYDSVFKDLDLKDVYGNNLRTPIVNDYVKMLQPYITKLATYKNVGENIKMSIEEYLSIENIAETREVMSKHFGLDKSMGEYFSDPIQFETQKVFVTDMSSSKLNKKLEGVVNAKEKQEISDQHIVSEIRGKANLSDVAPTIYGISNRVNSMLFDVKPGFIKQYLAKHPGYENLINYKIKTNKGKRSIELEFKGEKTRVVKLPESSKFDGKQETTQEMVNNNVSKKEKTLRKENADFHWNRLIETMEVSKELADGKTYGNVELAMLHSGLLGSMKTSLRSAALLKYLPINPTTKLLKDSKGKIWEYEHGIPAKNMSLILIDHFYRGNKVDLQKLKESYSVGIIHRDFNKNIGEVFQERMQFTYRIGDIPPKRWYNEWTAMGEAHVVKDIYTEKLYGEAQVNYWNKVKENHKKSIKEDNKRIKSIIGPKYSKSTKKEIIEDAKIIDKAIKLGRKKYIEKKGMSTFDFDETVGISGNYIIATKGKKTRKIASKEWPVIGEKLKKEGWKMDFTDFNKVTGGKPGPLMQKLKNQIKKYGPKNVFILTARAKESAPAIHEYLKSEGVKISLENITGLGNSTGEAKAMWMLKKFSEGYNDMYFVDDALSNVKAVKNVLDQLDIKSKVKQAIQYSKNNLNTDVNKILENSLGIEAKKKFSKAEAKVRGKDKKRRKFFVPDSAADLELLIEPLYGKGKEGVKNKKWFESNFLKPWERGVNDLNTARQTILNDYMSLRKNNKDVVKSLDKNVEGTNFTNDMAARVYIWNKAGFEVPGLTKTSKAKLLEHVTNNPKLRGFAENVAILTKIETGLKQPKETWWAETLASEVSETGRTVNRDKYIGDWIHQKNEIFSEQNLNKMEAELGPKWRESIENMLDRMETGKTRQRNLGRIGNSIMNYLNGSVGAIMNLNTRSATLQLISTVNFINHAENNPLAAAKAFANQPQYWKDFMKIMNSDMLRQRRDGLKINVTEAELAAAAEGSGNKAKKALAWILKQGYIPTKIADSFAISSGGATYYRNRIKMYEKQGLTAKEAEKKAWLDFQAIAERTQQSSRPDLLSQQQVSFEGRLILPFANTPMQMNRIMMKEVLDLSKGRYKGSFGENSFTNKMSKIAYYGFIQSALFAGLQSGYFALMANSDDEKQIAQKKTRMYNTVADSFLRGMGIPGAVVAGLKNAVFKFLEQNEKGFKADYSEVGEALLNISPTIGSKFSKLDAAGNTYAYNKKEILEKGLSLDNTKGMEAVATTIEAVTNVPIARVIRKTENIQGALDDENEAWQRLLMTLGWSEWDVGATDYQKKKEKSNTNKKDFTRKTFSKKTFKRKTFN